MPDPNVRPTDPGTPGRVEGGPGEGGQGAATVDAFFDLSLDLLAIASFETGRWVRVNRGMTRVLGWTEDEFLATPFLDIVHPDDVDHSLRATEELASDIPLVHFEHRVRCADGSYRWVEWQTSSIPSDGLLFCSGRDVTERHEAEEEIRELNQRLEARVEERTGQVRSLSRALTMAEQTERRRLAQILHDDLQQVLHGAQIQAEIGNVDRVATLLESASRTARSLSHELAPPILRGHDLGELFEWLAKRKRDFYGLEVDHEGGDVEVADEEVRVLLYRLLRELLFNVSKHSGADRARVSAEPCSGGVRVVVEDEGAGFDPSVLGEPERGGFGLASVRERLEGMGGSMEVVSAPGAGTRVVIEVPTDGG